MPTYEYECSTCGHHFECRQSMKEDAFSTCPEAHCKAEAGWGHGAVRRLLGTGAGLIFKGSGFYITDYRSESYKAGAKGESGAASSNSGTGSGNATGSGSGSAPAAPATPAPSSSASSTPAKPSSGS
jgi:putative FmdB family regulatory protein